MRLHAESGTRIATYQEFWPHYLREHAKPRTRQIHYAGTAIAAAGLLLLLLTGELRFLLLALIGGYAPAWIGHFFIEKNRPATFTHPPWSLWSDFRMAGLWAMGRLEPELAKAGIHPPAEPVQRPGL